MLNRKLRNKVGKLMMSISKENVFAIIDENSTSKYYIEHHEWK